MALSKQHLYPNEDQIISHYAKALSHPARLKILKQLQLEGPLCVQIIAQNHPISLEALSGHFKILREAQLVDFQEHFPYTFYAVNITNLKTAFKLLELFITFFQFKK